MFIFVSRLIADILFGMQCAQHQRSKKQRRKIKLYDDNNKTFYSWDLAPIAVVWGDICGSGPGTWIIVSKSFGQCWDAIV
jgi:hypothetical protein